MQTTFQKDATTAFAHRQNMLADPSRDLMRAHLAMQQYHLVSTLTAEVIEAERETNSAILRQFAH